MSEEQQANSTNGGGHLDHNDEHSQERRNKQTEINRERCERDGERGTEREREVKGGVILFQRTIHRRADVELHPQSKVRQTDSHQAIKFVE
jgi:hypothetical protein